MDQGKTDVTLLLNKYLVCLLWNKKQIMSFGGREEAKSEIDLNWLDNM